MAATNVVGERFQITIDKAIRDQLGIQPGDRAIEAIEHGRLVVYFMPKPHRRSQFGALKRPGQPTGPVNVEEQTERAWAARTTEIIEVLEADSRKHRELRERAQHD